MTHFEMYHPRYKANSGAAAYLAGIHFQNNPYRSNPNKSRWERGYRAAKSFTETFVLKKSRPVTAKPAIKPAIKTTPPRHSKWKTRKEENRPVMSQGRIERFNNRFRTAV